MIRRLLFAAILAVMALRALAAGEGDVTLQAQYAVDASGRLGIEPVAAGTLPLQPMERRAFALGESALWVRFEAPALDAAHRWYLQLSGTAFINRASLFTRGADGAWHEQRAGDHVPVAQWSHPDAVPLFELPPAGGIVWLRIENQPAPVSPSMQLLADDTLQARQQWRFLAIGAYLGFGLLVFAVGLLHARLYRDTAFVAYCVYVACMLLFQLAYTGMGGLLLWPHGAAFNDAAPALFMLWMTASGIWFVRQATAVSRHSRRIDRGVAAFSIFGALFALAYIAQPGALAYGVLNVYGLLAVVLSISLCAWTWLKGERYSGWLILGFAPVHIAYPFPALRAAGVLADSWATEYAVLIGSAIEIPLLLAILHARAKDFNENRARLKALDSTDPLTGLTTPPVLQLRLRDAVRRAFRLGHRCAVLLVEVANHGEIVAREGREAGDRALVVAAARLSQVVRDIDTVCRVADTRFAILLEGPQPEPARRMVAQHVVARGLEPLPHLPADLALRFRVVTSSAPDGGADEQHLLHAMNHALDRLLEEPKRVVAHLEPAQA